MQTFESYPLKRQMVDRARKRWRDYQPYTYEVRHAINATATDTVSIVPLDTDAPFLWLYGFGDIVQNVAGSTSCIHNAQLLATVRLGGPGARTYQRKPLPYNHLFCPRPQPFILPAPLLVPAGSVFHVTLNLESIAADSGGANTNIVFPFVVRSQFVGLKLYGWATA